MGMRFNALPPEAKRAAFAKMDAARKVAGLPRLNASSGKSDTGGTSSRSKSLGSGQRSKKMSAAAKSTDAKQSPPSTGQPASAMSYPELYHVATPDRAKSIMREGFKNMERDDGGGKVFGPGTYLSLTKDDSDGVLRDMHEAEYGDEVQIPISANVKNPFKVQVGFGDRGSGESALERTLKEKGLIGPDESYGDVVNNLDTLLTKAGYDAVEVKQDYYTSEVMGSQLVVFDPTAIKYGHDKPAAKPVQRKGRGLGSGARHRKLSTQRADLSATSLVVNPAPGGGFVSAGRISREEAAVRMFGTAGAATRIARARAKKR